MKRSLIWNRKMMGRLLTWSLMVSLAAGCNDADGQSGPHGEVADPVAVQVAPVQVGSMPRTVTVVGTLYGDEETTLSAKVPGRVERILADVGDRVAPGEALAEIDPTDYLLVIQQRERAVQQALAVLGLTELPPEDFDVSKIATVERARYQAANARAKLNRAKQLFEQQSPGISEQEFADLETAGEVAWRDYEVAILEGQTQLAVVQTRQSELQAARQRLRDATVRAPSRSLDTPPPDNQPSRTEPPSTQPNESEAQNPQEAEDRFGIAQRLVSIGEYVREGDPMFRLVADHPIKLRAAVPERYVSDVRVGQPVALRVEGRETSFAGTVRRVSPSIDIETRSFQIEVLVPNPDRRLRPGAFARASIQVGLRQPVTFVPRAAVVSFAGTDKVFSVADGKAIEHRVRLLDRTADDPVPLEGDLDGADQVIVSQLSLLANDIPVTIEPADGEQ